ncbi:Dihydropteroate synthase-like protein [Boletus edulis BED1]|uniref:2-amino-4-hydroxy-6-hydroxymethyldihydropteridine diphosphokinase n=1 Tax=Boletus edulis BED1 TaxID=1328754 RepID=A0AAD4GFE6_BOLED|nr:Dihydropteroate synthase-like protein [Boletus edulis BED1]
MTRPKDTIRVDKVPLTLSFAGDDANGEEEHLQAVLLSFILAHDISKAARSDDLTYSVDYTAAYAILIETLPKTRHASLEALVELVFETLFRIHLDVDEASVVVTLQGALPRFMIEATRKREQPLVRPYRFIIKKLGFSTITGSDPRERIEKQPVMFDITVDRKQHGSSQDWFPFVALATSIHQTFTASAYLIIESLTSAVACHVLEYTKDPDDTVTIKLSKVNALALAASAQIQITRQRDDFADVFAARGAKERLLPPPTVIRPEEEAVHSGSSSSHSVALALGSNLGDRFANIETALRLLEVPTSLLSDLPEDAQVSVVDTSFMYETAPMYVTDQPLFANCACMIETNLSPMDLLRLVKEIETAVGRVPAIRFGPRAVDLDILTYDDQLVDTRPPDRRASLDNLIGQLVIPHPRTCEREFVLRPLNDMIPHYIHPASNKTIRTLLDELVSTQADNDFPMLKVMPFPKYPSDAPESTKIHGIHVPPTAKYWTVSSNPAKHGRPRKTHLMATLNVTPDSFSDGAQHNTLPTALTYTTTAVASGADIIDIGGHSTRPGADTISTDEELARVLPVVQAIRVHPSPAVRDALLSIDTFRWAVAARAVLAGANCINDVHAFTGPAYPLNAASWEHLTRMRGVARELGVPVVLMHSRGDADENKGYDAYDNAGGIVAAVQAELGRKVDMIVRGPGGVRRWLVFVDPGIGFSKTVEGQLTLMRDLGRMTAPTPAHERDPAREHEDGQVGNALAGYPLLVGPSKKSVWGAVLEQGGVEGAYQGRKTSAQERGWATAAAVACAVQQGASAVRVHDVAEMRDVVTIASAIWNR